MNRVIFSGYLGRDPEIRFTQAGQKVANLSVADTQKWTDKKTGEVKERTEWARVSIFNEGVAGVVEMYLKKGSKVLIEGRMETRKWQDKDGVDRYTTEVVIPQLGGSLEMLDRAPSGGWPDDAPPPSSGDLDDEIPF